MPTDGRVRFQRNDAKGSRKRNTTVAASGVSTAASVRKAPRFGVLMAPERMEDRKSTRLNSSHVRISYAVFCLKKKKYKYHVQRPTGADCRNRRYEWSCR